MVSCYYTARIHQKMALNKRSLFIVTFCVTSCTTADRNGSDISIRFITGPSLFIGFVTFSLMLFALKPISLKKVSFYDFYMEEMGGSTIYQHNRQWHGTTPSEFFSEFVAPAIHPAPILRPQSSALPVAIVLRYITLPLCFCVVPLKATQRPFSPSSSFIFSGLGLLIKMLNATLEVTNTKFCCLTFSFSRYATLREPDALMNGWCTIQGDRLLWEN